MTPIRPVSGDFLISSFPSRAEGDKYFALSDLHINHGIILLPKSAPNEVFYLIERCRTKSEADLVRGGIYKRDQIVRAHYHSLYLKKYVPVGERTFDTLKQELERAEKDHEEALEKFDHLQMDPLVRRMLERQRKKIYRLRAKCDAAYGPTFLDLDGKDAVI